MLSKRWTPAGHGGVFAVARTLAHQLAIPLETVGLQGAQDGILGAGDFPGRVEVFHAQQPAAANGAGVEIGGEGGDQRAEV